MEEQWFEKNTKTRIGMFGLGTVGSGVIKFLNENYDSTKTGLEIEIAKVCVRDITKKREVYLPKELLTTNPNDILENPEIDTVVELVGGIEPAGAYILRALQNGKKVVTANKALLTFQRIGKDHYNAEEVKGMLREGKWIPGYGGILIFVSALSNQVNLGFEASVCGEIPIVNVISNMPSKGDINCLEGILNGTSNYILTKMNEGKSYEESLKEAQRLGFAEADSSFDVGGKDAAQKLSILASLTFGYNVGLDRILCESIREITNKDIDYTREFGYRIKSIALAKKHEVIEERGEKHDLLELRVCPTLVPKGDTLASVENEDNAVSLFFANGRRKDPMVFKGKGAGMMPTARAVVQDIATVNISSFRSRAYTYNLFTDYSNYFLEKSGDFTNSSYLRVDAENQPGTLGKIATLLGEKKINILNLIQREEDRGNGTMPIAMLLGSAKEGNMHETMVELNKQLYVKNTLRMRIQNTQ